MQSVRILPLSKVKPGLLLAYLGSRGFPEAVIRWKYLDESFNRGRERGYCALRGDEMIGFMGVIPVELRRGAETRSDRWLCDWSIEDPVRDKGVGGAIADAVLSSSGRMIAFGGTEAAKKRWRLKADSYDLDAGIVFRKHLTLGSFIGGLQRRRLWPRRLSVNKLRQVAVVPRRGDIEGVRLTEGVDPAVERLFQAGTEHWRPVYSLADLRWQLERCPQVECWTVLGEDEESAVLLWREKEGDGTWKLALLGSERSSNGLSLCLDCAVQHALGLGGASILAVVSRLDSPFIDVLHQSGFKASGTVNPIHFLDQDPRGIPSALERLSFLDADDGHRF